MKFLKKGIGLASAAVLLATSLGFAGQAVAQAKFPSGPVQIVVPFPPGGGADRTFRLFAPYLSKELGVPVNVINIAGGGGWVAWSEMAKWDPEKDDHKLGVVNLPHVMSLLDPRMKRKETLKSFNFLAWHSFDPCIWAVREGDERFGSLKEMLAYVKANPNEVVFSSTGVGSDDHMGIAYAEKFLDDFKVKKVYANNDGKKIQEVLGSHTDAVAGNVGYYVPYMLDAKLKAIAVLNDERWPALPNTPTFKEVTGLENVSYAGRTLVGAPGLAEDKAKVYIDAIKAAIDNPEYAMKEMNNRNFLMFQTGEKMWKTLESSAKAVSEVKYWELEEKK